MPRHGRKRTSNIPLTFWRLRLRLLFQDFPTPRLHHWVLVLGFPIDMTVLDRKEKRSSLDHLKSTKFGQIRCFSVSWDKQMNLLHIVHPVHWVLYPLPSWRQLWVQKTLRIKTRTTIIQVFLLWGSFTVGSIQCCKSYNKNEIVKDQCSPKSWNSMWREKNRCCVTIGLKLLKCNIITTHLRTSITYKRKDKVCRRILISAHCMVQTGSAFRAVTSLNYSRCSEAQQQLWRGWIPESILTDCLCSWYQ